MNKLLKIKLKFNPEPGPSGGGVRNLRSERIVDIEKVSQLISDLKRVKTYYASRRTLVKGCLIDIYYDDVIAKSNRVQQVLKGVKKPDDSIVGARFSDAPIGHENHIITHYVEFGAIDETINKFEFIISLLNEKLSGEANKENFNINKDGPNPISFKGYKKYSDSEIRGIIVDCSVIEKFDVPQVQNFKSTESVLITFYKTELKTSEILDKIYKNEYHRYYTYGENSLLVEPSVFERLSEEIPYLISMAVSDISCLSPVKKKDDTHKKILEISSPQNEPTIGVIDTVFNQDVYFSKWVDYRETLFDYEKSGIKDEDYYHGTAISSIIVDGHTLNPDLDDGCGRFKVRHFGVCGDRISPSLLMKKITSIVESNPDIHVWNLSLGTEQEVSKNFISFDASILDKLQAEKNIIFVVAGTNDNHPEETKKLRVGSPADSINSIVVNSVRRNNAPCSYSRKGPILSFFSKPDVSYYGGDYDEKISVYSPDGIIEEMGTSYATPWISRKLCYLIDIMGLPREVAKALIIDSAAGWEFKQGGYKNKDLIGYGVVPININNILSSDNSEIKFVLYETSKSYRTANYAIPIPKDNGNKYPYVARATLCYFPKCRREQGVDYTNRELSMMFGKVNRSGSIEDINYNTQEEGGYPKERKSRSEQRKWDNTKFVSSRFTPRVRGKTSFVDKYWGFSITSKERFISPQKEELNFGAVVTLKEINNINRIEEFKHACRLRGYIITELEVQNQINIYETAQQDIEFE